MRMLLRVSIPVETGNAAAKAGTLGSTVEKILADLKPEAAAYFLNDDNGNRSGSIVFDMKDSSQIPAIAEPWFLAFNAKISLRPVMNPQDLATAVPSITALPSPSKLSPSKTSAPMPAPSRSRSCDRCRRRPTLQPWRDPSRSRIGRPSSRPTSPFGLWPRR